MRPLCAITRLVDESTSPEPPNHRLIRHLRHTPPHQKHARRFGRALFLGVGFRSFRGLVRFVVEFDGGDDAAVFLANNEVVTQSIDAVIPFVEFESALHAEHARALHLREHDMFRQRFDEPPIENLFGLRERFLCVERPLSGFALSARKLFCEDREEQKQEDADDDRQKIRELHAVCFLSGSSVSSARIQALYLHKLIVIFGADVGYA
jgi:hypothetical protein